MAFQNYNKGLEIPIFSWFSQISQEALLSYSPLPCACIDATVGTPPSVVITLCKVAKRQHSFESSALVQHVLLVVPSSVSCGSLKSADTGQALAQHLTAAQLCSGGF